MGKVHLGYGVGTAGGGGGGGGGDAENAATMGLIFKLL